MNKREFTNLCKSYGFAQISSGHYARCIGDGILQIIYTGMQRYIDPSSPAYSSKNRKSSYISIGVYSLYSPWKEALFAPGVHLGEFCPATFVLAPSNHYKFMGIEIEYEQMRDSVLPAMDVINTQERYLDFYLKAHSYLRNGRRHDISLIAPYFMCQRMDDALLELCYHYMLCREHTRNHYGSLLQEGNFEEYYQEDTSMIERLSPWISIWDARMKRKPEIIRDFLSRNYDQNIEWIKKYNIPEVHNSFKRECTIQF